MPRSILCTAMLVLILVGHGSAQIRRGPSQEKPEKDRPTSDAHSFIELFTGLESDWSKAAQKRDQPTLDSFLAPEFRVVSSENPENPVSRADWIQLALADDHPQFGSVREMAIRAFLGVAIVSFVQDGKASGDQKDRSGDYLIVDVWETNHNRWQLSVRYIAPVTNHPIVSGLQSSQK